MRTWVWILVPKKPGMATSMPVTPTLQEAEMRTTGTCLLPVQLHLLWETLSQKNNSDTWSLPLASIHAHRCVRVHIYTPLKERRREGGEGGREGGRKKREFTRTFTVSFQICWVEKDRVAALASVKCFIFSKHGWEQPLASWTNTLRCTLHFCCNLSWGLRGSKLVFRSEKGKTGGNGRFEVGLFFFPLSRLHRTFFDTSLCFLHTVLRELSHHVWKNVSNFAIRLCPS